MDATRFPKLFEPGQIGKVKIKNRIVMSPLGTSFWGANGEVTEKLVDHYVARAKGGTGLITVSFACIDYPPGAASLGALDRMRLVAGNAEMVEALHSHGAKVSLQIMHRGRQVRVPPDVQVSSSATRCMFLGKKPYPVPRALEIGEIDRIIEMYGLLATNAKTAGYDMVEIHGAHGYLITAFMSPYMNKRTDEYGGSLENRMRFPLRVIRRMKEAVGDDFPVGIRISADEFLDGGVTIEESPRMAQMIEQAGAAFIHVSSGTYETLNRSNDMMRLPEGWKMYIWEAIKKAVKIPTFAAGGLKTPGYCEKVVADGKADYVALGRPLFADPEWANKAMRGREEEIRRCTSCMECLGFVTGRGVPATRCAVNVAMGREKIFGDIRPADVKKKVMVVGAGPAGMEAARIAALRGHDVTLYDKNSEIGGQLLVAAVPPGKEKLLWIRDYQKVQLKKLNVKTVLGKEVTAQLIEKAKPDAVIIATGSEPLKPDIPGIAGKKVVSAWDVLSGKVAIKNQKVAVAGGGMVGSETGEFLAEQGNTVTLIEMLPEIAQDMEPVNRKGLMEVLAEKNITMLTGHKVAEITEKGVVAVTGTGERKLVEADRVVVAMGSKPAGALADVLKGRQVESHAVGDCVEPRTIVASVYEGALAALRLGNGR